LAWYNVDIGIGKESYTRMTETNQKWDVFADYKARKIHQTTLNTLMGMCAYRFEMY